MPLFSETQEKIYGDILLEVLGDTNLTRSSPGSKMRTLIEAVSKKMGRMWSTFDLNIGQAFLDGAKGKYLDFIGDMMGLERLGEEPAIISAADRNVKFSVDVGTFGDINNGQSIIIPSNTIISTAPNGEGIRYRVIVNTLLASSTREGYVAVESVGSGNTVNIGAKQLVYHDFNQYEDSANGSLRVTNIGEITQGRNREADANYKFRISNRLLTLESANPMAVRIAALGVPGVADLVMIPFHRGVGTYDMLIKSQVPNISQSLIDSVQLAIDNVTAQGIVATARGPVEVGISLVGTLTLKNSISAQEQTSLISAATANVTDYINSLDIGEELIINEIIERVMNTSDLIKNLGTFSVPFDNKFIYKPSELEDNKVRGVLISDYAPEDDERVIVENVYGGATPILFRIAS